MSFFLVFALVLYVRATSRLTQIILVHQPPQCCIMLCTGDVQTVHVAALVACCRSVVQTNHGCQGSPSTCTCAAQVPDTHPTCDQQLCDIHCALVQSVHPCTMLESVDPKQRRKRVLMPLSSKSANQVIISSKTSWKRDWKESAFP